jgi:hypothetical protein
MRDEAKPLPEAGLRNRTCPNSPFNCCVLFGSSYYFGTHLKVTFKTIANGLMLED